MNAWNSGFPDYPYNYNDRDKIYESRRRKASLLSIILSVIIGTVIGLAVLYISGKLPFSISIILSAIGVVLAAASPYIAPLWTLSEKGIPRFRRELQGGNKLALAAICGTVALMIVSASLFIPKIFPNSISFLSPQPPSYLPANGSLIQNQLEVSDVHPQGTSVRYSCYFDDAGTYHASEKGPGYFSWCKAQQVDFGNVAVVADVKLVREDYCGLFVRAQDSNTPSMYYSLIFPDGTYHLDMSQGQSYNIKKSGTIPGFKHGQTNTIALLAKGSKISLYVNSILVASIDDDTYQDGTVGIISGNNSDVVFSNIQIWTYS